MLGTWINVAGIVGGGLIGLLLRKGISQEVNDAILKVEGLAILIIGLNGVLAAMLVADPETGRISDQGGLLLLISLVAGCALGEILKIDERLNHFGILMEQKSGARGFAKGFISASLIFSVGAMSIIGAINDGLQGDSSVLVMKAALDCTAAIVLASALGIGVLFSAVPVLIVQGSISLLAGFLSPIITDLLLDLFCMVGYAIVMVIGFNFLCDTRIKTANLLPALLFPIVYYFVRF